MSLNVDLVPKQLICFPCLFFFFCHQRYEEAAQAFREVLKLDGACAEAAQELMRVQIIELMVCSH